METNLNEIENQTGEKPVDDRKIFYIISFIIGIATLISFLVAWNNYLDVHKYGIIVTATIPGLLMAIIERLFSNTKDYLRVAAWSGVVVYLSLVITNIVLIKYFSFDFMFLVFIIVVYYPINIVTASVAGWILSYTIKNKESQI